MLLYGTIQNVQDQCVVFNFTSLAEGYNRLEIMPPHNLGAVSEIDFDQKYFNYIMTDDYRFVQMFNIVRLLHNGENVYLIITDDFWADILLESLLKLIQQRYGYNATRINCMEDLFTAGTGDIQSPQTIHNFDEDMDRYELCMGNYNVYNKGNNYASV